MSKHPKYTKREDALIVEYLPKIGYPGLLKMMPNRSHCGLVDRVKTLRSRGVVIGPAYIESHAKVHGNVEADKLVIKENLTKVGYRGLLKMLPHRNYRWIRKHIYMMRLEGVLSKHEKVPQFRVAPVSRRGTFLEVSTVDAPRSPGWRHALYMRGEVDHYECI